MSVQDYWFYVPREGMTGEHATTSTSQKKAGSARAVTTTPVIFGPFAPGDYHMVALDGADVIDGIPDNMVFRFQKVADATAAADLDDDHVWNASAVGETTRGVSFTQEYPYISIAAITGSAKTMNISIAKVKVRS